MCRIALSIGLMFGAVAWSALSVIIIFLIVPAFWEAIFGQRGAAFAAMGALVLMIWLSYKMMGVADRIGGITDMRRKTAEGPASHQDVPTSWPEYNAAIARNKRWAFYRRTRQFDRLRELEEEMQREREAERASEPGHR